MYGVWFSCLGGSTHTTLLNRVEFKAFRQVNSPQTDSLGHRRNVAPLSLFYWYFHANCSSELANCMPPSLTQFCYIRVSTSHLNSVYLSNARVNQNLPSCIPYTGRLWNSLPFVCFTTFLWLELFQEKCQDTSHTKLYLYPLPLFLLLSSLQGLATSRIFFPPWSVSF